MQAVLRAHPKLKWQGVSTWPPQLGGAYAPGDVFPVVDETTLADVEVHERDLFPLRLGVTVDYAGRKHSGQIWADDPEVIRKLYRFLRTRIGRSMHEIGEEVIDL
jgi:hypothetical protein